MYIVLFIYFYIQLNNVQVKNLSLYRKERERTRERITKKRWKDEPTGRRRLDSDHSGGGSTTPSRRTSATYQDDDRGRYYSSADTSGQQTPDDQVVS